MSNITERLDNLKKTISKLKESKLVDEDYIKIRITAFYAHLCHSNAKILYRRIKK